MAPRRPGYRSPARRRPVHRPARQPKQKISLPGALTVGALVLVVNSPALGITVILVVAVAVWYFRRRRPGQARIGAPIRPAAHIPYLHMTPGQFEHALADLCRRDGCTNVRVVGGAGDLGADVIATTPDGRRIVIQAKRFGQGTTVGSGDVQKVNGTYRDFHGGHLAAIVTTSRFTKPALTAADRVGIRCFDQHALAGWASRTGPAPWH